jgi:hypothetical protein
MGIQVFRRSGVQVLDVGFSPFAYLVGRLSFVVGQHLNTPTPEHPNA